MRKNNFKLCLEFSENTEMMSSSGMKRNYNFCLLPSVSLFLMGFWKGELVKSSCSLRIEKVKKWKSCGLRRLIKQVIMKIKVDI